MIRSTEAWNKYICCFVCPTRDVLELFEFQKNYRSRSSFQFSLHRKYEQVRCDGRNFCRPLEYWAPVTRSSERYSSTWMHVDRSQVECVSTWECNMDLSSENGGSRPPWDQDDYVTPQYTPILGAQFGLTRNSILVLSLPTISAQLSFLSLSFSAVTQCRTPRCLQQASTRTTPRSTTRNNALPISYSKPLTPCLHIRTWVNLNPRLIQLWRDTKEQNIFIFLLSRMIIPTSDLLWPHAGLFPRLQTRHMSLLRVIQRVPIIPPLPTPVRHIPTLVPRTPLPTNSKQWHWISKVFASRITLCRPLSTSMIRLIQHLSVPYLPRPYTTLLSYLQWSPTIGPVTLTMPHLGAAPSLPSYTLKSHLIPVPWVVIPLYPLLVYLKLKCRIKSSSHWCKDTLWSTTRRRTQRENISVRTALEVITIHHLFHCPLADILPAFARAYNLKTHKATHDPNRLKPHVCPHRTCGRSFSRKHDLGRHLVSIHRGDAPSTANGLHLSTSPAKRLIGVERGNRVWCNGCGKSSIGRSNPCDCHNVK